MKVIKRLFLEFLRFLCVNAIILLSYHLFMLPLVGGTFKCGGIYKANSKCGDAICLDGSCPLMNGICADGTKPVFNVGFWDGYCISKIQGCALIGLLLLFLIPLIIATIKHTISKLWIIYAFFPTVLLVFWTFNITR